MTFALDPQEVHRTAALLDDAALDVDDLLPLPVPDTGTTCERTEAGLATAADRVSALTQRLADQAGALRWLAPFTVWLDDDVAGRLPDVAGR